MGDNEWGDNLFSSKFNFAIASPDFANLLYLDVSPLFGTLYRSLRQCFSNCTHVLSTPCLGQKPPHTCTAEEQAFTGLLPPPSVQLLRLHLGACEAPLLCLCQPRGGPHQGRHPAVHSEERHHAAGDAAQGKGARFCCSLDASSCALIGWLRQRGAPGWAKQAIKRAAAPQSTSQLLLSNLPPCSRLCAARCVVSAREQV